VWRRGRGAGGACVVGLRTWGQRLYCRLLTGSRGKNNSVSLVCRIENLGVGAGAFMQSGLRSMHHLIWLE
jgi:hypothetical protein